MDLKEEIYAFVLQNAVKHKGKAQAGAIVGKILGDKPELKSQLKDIRKQINEIISKVNSMKLDEQEQELVKVAPGLLEEKQEEKPRELPELLNILNKPIFRFAPSPSGPMHIGHVFYMLLNAEYSKKYNGEFILRIEDTNSENIDPNAYELLEQDGIWATSGKIDKIVVQSDRLEAYYNYAIKAITKGFAYVCTCSSEKFKILVDKGQACPCRDNTPEDNLTKWNNMFTTYKEGDAVLRIKTDLKHKNPAIREWPAFRINDAEHPRTGKKYRVWPLMNFSTTVDDHDFEITHVIRGKDHIVNVERQKFLYSYFNWKLPEFYHLLRINFTDLKISASAFRKGIEEGKYTGWDDIRLPTLLALKRRGILPEAFRRFVIEIGMSKRDKTVAYDEFMKLIYFFNREIIEKMANRYFFIENPKLIIIEGAPNLEAEMPLHPDFKERGNRKVKTSKEFYIQDDIGGNIVYRFMHLFNFKNNKFVSLEHDQNLNAKMIHWLPKSDKLVKVEVLMPDGTIKKGLGEELLNELEVGDMIQFERFAFCKLDEKSKNKLVFCYTHI